MSAAGPVPSGTTGPEAPAGLPAGLAQGDLAGWMRDRFGIAEFTARALSVGRSNLTYLLEVDGAPRFVLRRPPLGHTGGSAHDVVREGRIMAGLANTPVPVPRIAALAEAGAPLECPFVLMEYVPGSAMSETHHLTDLTPEARKECGLRMIDVMAAIHTVDIDAVGLEWLRKPGSLLERQLRRWMLQFEASAGRDLPIMHELHAELVARMPQEGGPGTGTAGARTGIAHGDFKPNNLIFGFSPPPRPRPAALGTRPLAHTAEVPPVNAVVDWELTAYGDVLTDLGYFICTLETQRDHAVVWMPTYADGMPSRAEVIERYVAAGGTEPVDLPFYIAFAMWKLAAIREGVNARIANGQMADLDLAAEVDWDAVPALAEQAREVLHSDSAS